MASLRQIAVFKEVMQALKSNKPVSISTAMKKHGYSEAMAHNPQKLTNADGWKELMQQYLPDTKLLKAHEQALEAVKYNDFTGEKEVDHNIRLKAVKMAYDLKGRSVEIGGITNQQINISLDGTGYIPPDNVLNIKPTKLKYYKKAK